MSDISNKLIYLFEENSIILLDFSLILNENGYLNTTSFLRCNNLFTDWDEHTPDLAIVVTPQKCKNLHSKINELQSKHKTPIVFVSEDIEEDKKLILNTELCYFIGKPILSDILINAVKTMLGERTLAQTKR